MIILFVNSLLRRLKILAFLVLGLFALAACVNEWTPEGGWASFSANEDWIYVAAREGRVVRLERSTARVDVNWAYPPVGSDGLGAIYSAPLLSDGVVYGAGYNCSGTSCSGEIFAVSENGRFAWGAGPVRLPNARLVSSPALVGDTLLVSTDNTNDDEGSFGFLYALEAAADYDKSVQEQVAQRVKWRLPIEGAAWGGIAASGDTIYIGTRAGIIYALDVSDKSEYEINVKDRVLWTFDLGLPIVSTPLVMDGKLYIGSFASSDNFFALDIEERASDPEGLSLHPSKEWTFSVGSQVWARPLLIDGTLYVFGLDGSIHALDPNTGSALWDSSPNIGSPIVSPPVLLEAGGDRFLAVPSFEQDVHIVTLPDGLYEKRLYDTDNGVAASPVFLDGSLYVHTRNGEVRRFHPISLNLQSCIRNLADRQSESCG